MVALGGGATFSRWPGCSWPLPAASLLLAVAAACTESLDQIGESGRDNDATADGPGQLEAAGPEPPPCPRGKIPYGSPENCVCAGASFWCEADKACHATRSWTGCGPCGVGCPPDQACLRGAGPSPAPCALRCDSGAPVEGEDMHIFCAIGGSTECIDVASDEAHCGTCNKPCTANAQCLRGTCRTRCDGGFECGAAGCVDALNDRTNCGCWGTCLGLRICVEGECKEPDGGS
jgi:hypothetical protein